MTTDSAPTKPKSSVLKWLLIGTAVLASILFFTNPDQTQHLKSINEVVELRYPRTRPGFLNGNEVRKTGLIEYHNYVLFSITGFADMTFSYGFLGRVQTTNDISFVGTGYMPND